MGGMEKTDNAELEKQIIERLENGGNKNDIILDLCENANMNWTQAEAMVEEVHAENQAHITLARSPLLVSIALIIFIGGAGIIVYSVYDLFVMYSVFRDMYAPTNPPGVAMGFLWYLFINGEGLLGMTILGTAMMIGSMRGMQSLVITHKSVSPAVALRMQAAVQLPPELMGNHQCSLSGRRSLRNWGYFKPANNRYLIANTHKPCVFSIFPNWRTSLPKNSVSKTTSIWHSSGCPSITAA